MKKIYFLFSAILLLTFSGSIKSQVTWTIYTATNSILGSDNYGCIKIDQTGNVWVGSSYAGLYKYNGTTWSKFNTSNSNLLYNDIYDLVVDNSNKIWAANYKGVSVFNGTTFTNYDTINAPFNGYSVYALGKDNNGKIFLSSKNGSFGYQGITTFDGVTWANLTGYPSQINGAEFLDFAFNSSNVGYIASGSGVTKYNSNTFTFYPKAVTGLWSSTCVEIDNNGNTWWAGFDGLLKYDGTNWTYYDNVADLGVTSNTIYYDMLADGNILWLASTDGFMKFDRTTGTVLANYTSTNSPLPTNGVFGIAKDASNNLWLSTIDMVVKTNLSVVGIKENAPNVKFNLYPNPSEGIFNLSCDNAQNVAYKVYSSTGALLIEDKILSKNIKIDLNDQAKGIYFLHITTDNSSTQVLKLMKK